MPARDDKPSAFTQTSARRVVRAVRLVERGNRDMRAKPLRTAWDDGGSSVRLGRFSGAWPVGQLRMVRFETPTSTEEAEEEEVEAMNLFCAVGGSCAGSRWCAIFEEGGQWYLLAAECGAG